MPRTEATCSSQHSPRLTLWFCLLGGILAAAVYLVLALPAFEYIIDDSFISLRYARNLGEYGQLVWNVGEACKVEGYTSLLWVLICSLVWNVVPEPSFVDVCEGLGLACGVLAIVVTAFVSRRLCRHPFLVCLPPILLAVCGPMVAWGVSAMETTFYVLLIVTATWLLLQEEDHALHYATPVVLLLIALTRTEGVVFYGAVVLLRLFLGVIRKDPRYTLSNRRFLVWNGIWIAGFSAYLLWKLWYYGSIIPLPVHIKQASGIEGLLYLESFWVLHWAYVLPMVLGIHAGFGSGYKSRLVWYLTLPFLLFTVAIGCANPIMGHNFRLLLAAFPFLFLLAAIGLDRVLPPTSSRVLYWAIALVCGVVLIKPLVGTWSSYYDRLGLQEAEIINEVHIPLGHWLKMAARGDKSAAVALGDAGASAFYSELDCIDMLGLNNIDVAKNGFSADRILDAKPRFIVLKSRPGNTFNPSDTEYGRRSQQLFDHFVFQRDYGHAKTFFIADPFYCLWIYERKPDAPSSDRSPA